VEVSQVVEKWKAEGHTEGMILARREDVFDVLQDLFPEGPPEVVREAINRETNLQTLRAWFLLAVRATSLDRVRTAVTGKAG
jgi:hypothetical protein